MSQFHQDGSQPNDGSVFVFGSNLAGRHGAGAALAAEKRFGAVYGKGAGRMGMSYAIPTKDYEMRTMSVGEIGLQVLAFLQHTEAHPNESFFVTRVGCGLAGHTDDEMAPLFRDAPENCSFAQQWRPYLSTQR